MDLYDLLDDKENLKKELMKLNLDQLEELIKKQAKYNLKLQQKIIEIENEEQ